MIGLSHRHNEVNRLSSCVRAAQVKTTTSGIVRFVLCCGRLLVVFVDYYACFEKSSKSLRRVENLSLESMAADADPLSQRVELEFNAKERDE